MSTPEEINKDSIYPWPEDGSPLLIAGAPDQFTMMFVTYIKGEGMSVRGVIIPGSRMDLYWEDVDREDLCACHPGMGWSLDAIDPETGRFVRTQTLDTHVALAWMLRPSDILELELDGLQACEELVFVPEGEQLQTVFNDFNGYVSGGLTLKEGVVSDDAIAEFFNKGDE